MPSKPTEKSRPSKIEAAFFDVDNTILRGSSTFLWGQAAFRYGYFSRKDLWRFAYQQFKFIWRGEGATNLSKLLDKALSLIEGHSATSLTAMADEVYNKYFKPKLWPETVRLAKAHVAAGREVWLVTAAPQEIADVLAHRLGLTGGLGTLIERDGDMLTGKLVGKTLHGKAKRRAIKTLAKDRHISLKRSYAYSDSSNDLPMLTAVGHAVVVNPDKRLEAHAKAAGWPMLDFKRRELKANESVSRAERKALEVKEVKHPKPVK